MKFKIFNDKGFWKNAIKLATPIALQNMLISSFTLADTLFVSRLGDVSLSAVGMIGQWGWLLNMIIIGISSGTSVFVSQYWGIKDKRRINMTCGIAVISVLLVSGVFTAVSFFFPELVVNIFNGEDNVITEGKEYLLIVLFSYPAVAISNILSSVLRSVERVRLPMYVSVLTTVLNIFLDYGMIFGKFGFNEMGIKGAALATSISAWVGVAAILLISVIEKNILIAPLKTTFGFKLEDVSAFYKKAFPVIFNESMWGVGTFAFNIIFGHMGHEYFAALTILRSFENIAFVFFIGICTACCIMVGKSVGKGMIERGIQDSKRFMIIAPILAIFISILIYIFRPQLIGIFNMGNNISDVTLKTAMTIMAFYAFEFTVRQIPYISIVGVFRSGGDTVTGVKYDLCCLWGLSLPATLIAVYVLKLPFTVAFAVMYIFEDYVKTALCIRYYRSLKWIKPVTDEGKNGLEEFLKKKDVECDGAR
ncbi:MAG: MATE family efflux transporter [Oscillospiraceae bacterium]|nr:MATE family efflux transporter [Oscillospiraceae bacterium]